MKNEQNALKLKDPPQPWITTPHRLQHAHVNVQHNATKDTMKMGSTADRRMDDITDGWINGWLDGIMDSC